MMRSSVRSRLAPPNSFLAFQSASGTRAAVRAVDAVRSRRPELERKPQQRIGEQILVLLTVDARVVVAEAARTHQCAGARRNRRRGGWSIRMSEAHHVPQLVREVCQVDAEARVRIAGDDLRAGRSRAERDA